MLGSKIKRICCVGTMHSLLHYLLLSSVEDIQRTYFFFTEKGVSNVTKEKLSNVSSTVKEYLKNN